jgi:hypothetical protein
VRRLRRRDDALRPGELQGSCSTVHQQTRRAPMLWCRSSFIHCPLTKGRVGYLGSIQSAV